MSNETVNTGVQQDARSQVVETLNRLLADEHVLYVKTRNYHWNIRGPRFNDLHKFFEEQYTQLAIIIDEVAEQARQFGGYALGSMQSFIETAQLKEQGSADFPDADGMIDNLIKDHETIVRFLRPESIKADEELEVPEAGEFLRGVLQQHNKMAWMLRAFLTARR